MFRLNKDIDFTTGKFVPKMILFAIPVILSSYLQLFYNAADQIIISSSGANGNSYLAAIGVTGNTTNLLLNLFLGLSIGAGVTFANAIGARDYQKCKNTLHTSITIAAISGLFIAILGFIFSKQILKLQNVDKDILDLSTKYIRILFIGTPFNMIYNFGASILRASGDSKRPLYFLGISGLVNVVLNLAFVKLFNMNVDGVAIATVISQVISALLVIYYMIRDEGFCHLSFKYLGIYKEELQSILKIGVPSCVTGIVFSFSNMVIYTSINEYGKAASAGTTAAGNLDAAVYYAFNGFSQAAMTFSGQNFGAKKYNNMRKILNKCNIIIIIVSIVMSGIIYFCSDPLLNIFISKNGDFFEEAIYYGKIKVTWVVLPYVLHGLAESYFAMLRGWGKTVASSIISLASICGFRMIWMFAIVPLFPGQFNVILMVYITSWIIEVIGMAAYYYIAEHKLIKNKV